MPRYAAVRNTRENPPRLHSKALNSREYQSLECDIRHFRAEKQFTAIDLLSRQIEQQRLQESVARYAEAYEQDDETGEWTEGAVTAWPK